MMTLPTSPKEARALGLTKYFTGTPCARGHLAERSASSRGCLACQAEASAACRERHLERFLARERMNHERRREASREYALRRYQTNRESVRAASRKWDAANKHKVTAKAARRKAEKLRATPPWTNMKAIEGFYSEARRITEATGIPHEVDHIFPLKGKTSCGLHVPWNLQILTKSENSRKKNREPWEIDAALTPSPASK